MMFFIMISLITMIFFMNSSHPVALMASIMTQTLNVCMVIWMFCNFSWFSFILFLIFLGGLMVLFIYIVSLASNEKFSLKMEPTFLMGLTLMISILIMILNTENTITAEQSNLIKNLTWMYSDNMMTITAAAMIYLLLTLIVVVKMTSKYSGPLRGMIMKIKN